MKRTKTENKKLAETVELIHDTDGLSFDKIGHKLGISGSYADKLHRQLKSGFFGEPKIIEAMKEEFSLYGEIEEKERVTGIFFGVDDKSWLRSIEVSFFIPAGLKGAKRELLIGSEAIKKLKFEET
jgi:hypothetical protein